MTGNDQGNFRYYTEIKSVEEVEEDEEAVVQTIRYMVVEETRVLTKQRQNYYPKQKQQQKIRK